MKKAAIIPGMCVFELSSGETSGKHGSHDGMHRTSVKEQSDVTQ